MNTQQKIESFLSRFKGAKIENEYNPTPRIQSTVKPKEKLTYNEISEHIYKQLKIK